MNTDLLIQSLSDGQAFGKNGSLSLAQWCESEEESRVLESMNNKERFYVASDCSPGNGWLRAIPLA